MWAALWKHVKCCQRRFLNPFCREIMLNITHNSLNTLNLEWNVHLEKDQIRNVLYTTPFLAQGTTRVLATVRCLLAVSHSSVLTLCYSVQQIWNSHFIHQSDVILCRVTTLLSNDPGHKLLAWWVSRRDVRRLSIENVFFSYVDLLTANSSRTYGTFWTHMFQNSGKEPAWTLECMAEF